MGSILNRGDAIEKVGNPQGQYQMTIQYCGGWGYRKHVVKVQREVEKVHPKLFQFIFLKDQGVTGNLEVHVSSMENGATVGDKVLVHSKRSKGHRYPHNDWEGFHSRLR